MNKDNESRSMELPQEVIDFENSLKPMYFIRKNILEVSFWLFATALYIYVQNWTAVILVGVILILTYRIHMVDMLSEKQNETIEAIGRMIEEAKEKQDARTNA